MTLKGQAKVRIKQNLKTLKIYGYGQKINNNDPPKKNANEDKTKWLS